MSSTDKRFADLFIPIGRPASSTSTITTGSSANTATVKSGSSSPTTVSSRKSTHDATPQTAAVDSPSSTRYTISAPTHDINVQHCEPVTVNTNQEERPNTVHIRCHSRKAASSASPVQELTMRLSRATGTTTASASTCMLRETQQTQQTEPHSDKSNRKESTPVVTAPTPFTSPETTPVPTEIANFSNFRASSVSTDPLKTDKTTLISRSEVFPPNLSAPVRLGSHSRSSSRSNQSFPPASFPSDFYEKCINSGPSRKSLSLSRSSSMRQSPLSTSPRSRSPLTVQIASQESTIAKLPARKEQPSRTHTPNGSSSITYQVNHNVDISTSAPTDTSTFHTTIHQYADCPHTSPPCTRPLNTLPTMDETCSPPRSTISGLCFDCDTDLRRDLESSILINYNPRISAHMIDLSNAISSLEAMSPVSPLSPVVQSAQFQSLSLGNTLASDTTPNSLPNDGDERSRQGSHSSLVSEDQDSESIGFRIQALENRITELTISRDKEVRDAWRGYTQRWGPGTLGIIRGMNADRAAFGTPGTGTSSRTSTESRRSQTETTEGRMKVEWIRDRF